MLKNKLTAVRPAPTKCADCPIRQRRCFRWSPTTICRMPSPRRTAQYRLAARSHLYQETAPAAMAYTLFEGWLLLYRTHSDGSRQGLRVALPGDFVGYAPIDGLRIQPQRPGRQ